MYANEDNLEPVQEADVPQLTEDDIVSYLVAVGANSCRRNYDHQAKSVYDEYLKLPLTVIVDSWDHLDQNVKLAVIDAKSDEFKSWVRGQSNA